MSCQGPYERSSTARGECRGSVDQQEVSTQARQPSEWDDTRRHELGVTRHTVPPVETGR